MYCSPAIEKSKIQRCVFEPMRVMSLTIEEAGSR